MIAAIRVCSLGVCVRLRLITSIVGAFCLIVGFQNCSKTSGGGQANPSISGSLTQISSDLSSNQIYVDQRLAAHGTYTEPAEFSVETILSIQFDELNAASATGQFHYEINLASGVIADISNPSQPVLVSTLSAAQLATIANLVTGATLTNLQLLSDQPIVCSDDFVAAYGQLITDQAQHLLGAGSPNCPAQDLYATADPSGPIQRLALSAALSALIP